MFRSFVLFIASHFSQFQAVTFYHVFKFLNFYFIRYLTSLLRLLVRYHTSNTRREIPYPGASICIIRHVIIKKRSITLEFEQTLCKNHSRKSIHRIRNGLFVEYFLIEFSSFIILWKKVLLYHMPLESLSSNTTYIIYDSTLWTPCPLLDRVHFPLKAGEHRNVGQAGKFEFCFLFLLFSITNEMRSKAFCSSTRWSLLISYSLLNLLPCYFI